MCRGASKHTLIAKPPNDPPQAFNGFNRDLAPSFNGHGMIGQERFKFTLELITYLWKYRRTHR